MKNILNLAIPVLILFMFHGCATEDLCKGGPENAAIDGSYTEAICSENAVATLEQVVLGNQNQWVLIRGYDVSNPVLIFLHGGPGSPCIFYSRYAMAGLEHDFTVVSWDQRGCGKSYADYIDPGSITYQQLMSDAQELILHMRNRFGVDKVYLMGISWGSILGSRIARDHPEWLHAYIGIGQVVNVLRTLPIAFQAVMDEALELGNQQAIDELTALLNDGTIDWDESNTIQKWLEVFGFGDLHDTSLYETLAPVLSTVPEYTQADWNNQERWEDLYQAAAINQDNTWLTSLDLISQIPRLDVPVFFFCGTFDYKTPSILVEEYVDGLEAPFGKQIVWFENSAHMPLIEERNAFHQAMIHTVKAETQ